MIGGRTYKDVGYTKTYYYSKLFKVNWVEAKAICKAFDLELATFETSEEAKNFLNITANFEHHYVLVDGIALTQESPTDWYWTNSGKKIPYDIEWADGEPNYYEAEERCLSIGIGNKKKYLGFNDYQCWSDTIPFICETF